VESELSLIAAFVKRNKRDRYREILSNPRLRHKFTKQLAHFADFEVVSLKHFGECRCRCWSSIEDS